MKYPEVIRVIPLLLAERESVIKVLESIDTVKYKVIDFHKKFYKSNEINLIVDFVKKSGLLDIICQMESAGDYLLGVEVGLDTNARKNRSGSFLEDLVKQSINKSFSGNKDLILLEQKFFKTIREEYNVEIPLTLSDRKSDFVLILNKIALNIEVNYYGGTGSKPTEIISSYINRNQVLKASGWRFVWLTDGIGWKGMRQPLKIGLENIDYIINTNLLNKGILEKIILTE
jgi:type II restriction enzyme